MPPNRAMPGGGGRPLRFLIHIGAILFVLGGATTGYADADQAMGGKTVFGWSESVRLYPGDLRLNAKLDSGAETSSLHAEPIERFTRHGEQWVRFRIVLSDGAVSETLERPLVRMVRIRQIGREALVRPVIELGVCIGRVYRGDVQFSLEDRSGFDYPALLGRRFLADIALIDPARKFMAEPDCGY